VPLFIRNRAVPTPSVVKEPIHLSLNELIGSQQLECKDDDMS